MVPTSQKYRPIRFSLLLLGAPVATHDLRVRPGELTRIEPQRTNVHNTLGGAYIDAFGAGIQQVMLSGVTGWHGGEEAFHSLRNTINNWGTLRSDRVSAALDPDLVELIFVDTLDRMSLVVAPLEFSLMRTKHSPLMLQYRIRLAVVRELSAGLGFFDAILGAITDVVGRATASIAALTGIAGIQTAGAAVVSGMRSTLGPLASAADSYLRMSSNLLSIVTSGVLPNGTISAELAPTYSLAMSVQLAGRGIFTSLADVLLLPQAVCHELNAIASSFTSAYCSLRNGFDQLRFCDDIEPLFGASNCSSTGGGRRASAYTETGVNPFRTVFPPTVAGIQTPESRAAMAAAVALDPVVTSLSAAEAAARLIAIRSGIVA